MLLLYSFLLIKCVSRLLSFGSKRIVPKLAVASWGIELGCASGIKRVIYVVLPKYGMYMAEVRLFLIMGNSMSLKDSLVCLGALVARVGLSVWPNGTTLLDSKLSHIWSDKFVLLLPFVRYYKREQIYSLP